MQQWLQLFTPTRKGHQQQLIPFLEDFYVQSWMMHLQMQSPLL